MSMTCNRRRIRLDSPDSPRGSRIARTRLHVPLLRAGAAIGVIAVSRLQVHPFSDSQIRLLETFADQAVIAIENARLFQELERRNPSFRRATPVTEALEQQTATAEVLRVIASSPTDFDSVLQTIVGAAARLCRAATGACSESANDDGMLIARAWAGRQLERVQQPAARECLEPYTASSTPATGRSDRGPCLRRATHDQRRRIGRGGPVPSFPSTRQTQARLGYRSSLVVPLLRRWGRPSGFSICYATRFAHFNGREIALVEAFADQAVIAIENARLFEELEQRNAELQESNRQVTEALEQQTATAEVLRVIASSPTDVRAGAGRHRRARRRGLCAAGDRPISAARGRRVCRSREDRGRCRSIVGDDRRSPAGPSASQRHPRACRC